MIEKADRPSVPYRPRRRSALAIPALLAAFALAAPALAQTTPQDQAIAQSLYDEGRTLMTAKSFAQACPKLEESQRLDPSAATEFHLADCYEQIGRTASAWAAFLEVASTSKLAGRGERERVARDRADALVPKLTKLTVTVPATVQTPGLVVKRNGTIVRDGQWGAAVPVDPGPQSVEASAPGKVTWQTQGQAVGEGKTATIEVPPLVDAPVAVAAPAATTTVAGPAPTTPSSATADESSPSSHGATQRILGVAVGVVGVVGLAVGGIFGAAAVGKKSDSNADGHCTGNVCDAAGVSLRQDAVNAGNLSTIAFIAGGVAVAGGAVLWLTAPSGHAVQVAPAVGYGSYGAVVRGAW